ncbi:hypothetical protein [Oscillatoria acuminata]|uniref:Uncharacterized protein n=1 Tax=Oscillatoria acuminata PCC 6304 TaxID=56110 RepID=K9TNJ3_9CYAN|nr:hypothetical protein [Oscillatoria acuminata]AFY84412.1 hypothetical protein Oscil6304_4908 [Oscillatoria acuminata PCC 6304]
MIKINHSRQSKNSQAPQTLPLLKPGSLGWVNPQINENLLKSDSLTTKQVEERFGIPATNLRCCHINYVLPWKTYLIFHQGRDRWKIYTEAAV